MSQQTSTQITSLASGLANKTNFTKLTELKFQQLHYYAVKNHESGPYVGSKCIYVFLSSLFNEEGKFIDINTISQTGPRKLYLFKFFVGKMATFGKSVITSFTMMSFDQESDQYFCYCNPNIVQEIDELNFVPLIGLISSARSSDELNSFKSFFTTQFTSVLSIDDIQGIKIKIGDKYHDAKGLVNGFKVFFLFCLMCNLFNSILDIKNAYEYLFKKNLPVKIQQTDNAGKIKIPKKKDIFGDEQPEGWEFIVSEAIQTLAEANETNPIESDDLTSEVGSDTSSLQSVSTVSTVSTAATGSSSGKAFLSDEDRLAIIKKGYEGINKMSTDTPDILKQIKDAFKSNQNIYDNGVVFETKNNPIMKNISDITKETMRRYAALYSSKVIRGVNTSINNENFKYMFGEKTE